MKAKNLLNNFNSGLWNMRELFHRTGRLEDSNSKLDEITKLLCLELVSVKDPAIGVPSLRSIVENYESKPGIVKALNSTLVIAAKSRILRNYDGESLLGPNPKFSISESEDFLAQELVHIIIESFNDHLRASENTDTFEFLNEAFGHFVRENFRQNIEDAQYMTPPEVVNFMVKLGSKTLMEDQDNKQKELIVCDPSCGEGSFLAQFYRVWLASMKMQKTKIKLVGQDKVDRMARLSLLNLSLFGVSKPAISRGNSLMPGSPLDELNGKCDLILTNPPFGARFPCFELADYSTTLYPSLRNYIKRKQGQIDSELLFVDRYISLLKPGGTVLAVLPDSVVSSSGLPAFLREILSNNWSIRSVTALPSVTFAQAGTRTKTCVLEIKKTRPKKSSITILSNVTSIGFEVSIRKGVPYKKLDGENELTVLADMVIEKLPYVKQNSELEVLCNQPSSVIAPQTYITAEGWTPSHCSSSRLHALDAIKKFEGNPEYYVYHLSDLVSNPPTKRRGIPTSGSEKCISVLHVGDFGSLNMRELLNYEPKTPGKICSRGDLLFSKINPRIPRALVVPDIPFELTCSTEFEVMRVRDGFDPYEVMLLLLSDVAQNQIKALTSGTSSSHNRIKTRELMTVKIPIPRKDSSLRSEYESIIDKFRVANETLNKSNTVLAESWRELNKKLFPMMKI